MSAHTEFDLGSLIWVKGEIDQALDKARQCLDKYAAKADAAELKFVQTHLHQVRGAVEMVGLSGAARFAEELEVAVGAVERGEASASLLGLIAEAATSLSQYLEALVNGSPDLALKLLPAYRRVRAERGESQSSGADLFFPSLSAELPPQLSANKRDDAEQAAYLKAARARFEAGLLKWLKGERKESGTWMAQALYGVARSQSSSLQRSFWWAAAAVAEGSLDNTAQLDIDLKQLFSRLNQQLKRLNEGAGKVAERLFRDVLYTVAHLETRSPQCAAVRQAFSLAEMLPAGALEDDTQQLAMLQLVRELRELVAQMKDNWARVGSGGTDRLPSFKQQLAELGRRSAQIQLSGFDGLLHALSEVLSKQDKTPSESLALEVATALLLLENALLIFPERSSDFPAQSDAMQARLRNGSTGELDVSLLDEVSRRAQERLLMVQVAQEILTNLAQVEQTLDDFFRDSSTRAELQQTDAPLRQIRGALTILDERDALALLEAGAEIVRRCQIDGYEAAADELEFLAEAFSSLGFYIDALKREEADRIRLIAPWLQKIGHEPAQPVIDVAQEAAAAQQEAQAQERVDALEVEDSKPLAAPAPSPVHAPVSQAVSEAAVDAELLEVYLEEAVDVLDTINSHVDVVRDQSGNKDALTVIRRGFHTLKGSGRMVGLNQLGEVAWAIEQVMNKWLQDEKHATPALLSLLERTSAQFTQWVGELQASGTAQVDAAALFAEAERLKSGAEPDAQELASTAAQLQSDAVAQDVIELDALPALDDADDVSTLETDHIELTLDQPEAVAAVEAAPASLDFDLDDAPSLEPGSLTLPEAEPAPEAADLQIGDISISRSLFGIFLDEAYRHFATLNNAFIDFNSSGEVEAAFVHAAHTLCGIANTTGFHALGELGYAIEQALLAYQKAGVAPAQVDYDTLSMAIDKVGVMLGQISRYETPAEEAQTVAMLQVVSNRLKDADLASSALAEPVAEPTLDTHLALALPDEDSTAASEELTLELDSEAPLDLDFDSLVGEELAAPLVEATEESGSTEAEISPVLAAELPAIDLPDLEGLSLDIELDDLPSSVDASVPSEAQPEEAMPAAAAEEIVLDIVDLDFDAPEVSTVEIGETPVESAASVPSLEAPAEEIVSEAPALSAELDADTDLLLDIEMPLALTPVADPIEPAELTEPLVLDDLVEVMAPPESLEDALSDIPLAQVDEALIVEQTQEAEPAALDESELQVEVIAVAAPETEPVIEEPAPIISTAAEPDGVGSVAALGNSDRLADITVQDELDEQLLPIFIEEAQELLPQVSAELRALGEESTRHEALESLKRVLHTLKGSARMAGAMRLGEATHNMETRLLNAGEAVVPALLDELEADLDAITLLQDRLIHGEPAEEDAAEAIAAETETQPQALAVPGAAAAAPARSAPMQALGLSDPEAGKSTVRVRADLVDRLVNQAGEVSISRTRIESEMLALKRSLLDLTDNVGRLRGQLREIEIQAESQMQSRMAQASDLPDFDPLEFDRFSRLQELTRFMAESVNDVATVQHNLLKILDESSAALVQQARMTRDLQQELMRVRMVPFSSVSERLYRVVRQTGKETGKKVNLEIKGGRVEIDRSVLEKMVSPFEHMLRNGIDHGLESTEVRLAAGKNEFGEIVVEARQEGNELVLVLRDDGAGLNLARIRQKGIEQGLIEAGGDYTDAQIMALIFEAGFSTANQVTQLSGRGIGMDVVKSELEDLGGRVEVSSEAGRGTTFTIHLPLTLAVTQAVLIKVGGKLFAIPSVMVEQVQELKMEPLHQLYQRHQLEWMGNQYPFHYLPRLLGDYDSQPEQKRYNTIMLLRSGVSRIAIHVDELVKNQEVVVKNIGPQLVRVAGVAGATVLGNGEIVLLLNPLALLQRRADAPVADFDAAMAASAPLPEEQLQVAPVVMVVDDSLTVRKITGRLLAREGYQVETAKDGVDALQKLQDIRPAVMLLDVEMPRMDGFELTRNLRANADTRDIPIIMITSRTADKHKNYAFELGVNAFLGKPYQEDELLEHIRKFTGEEMPIA